MTFCVYCFKKIDSLRMKCPHCGAPPVYKSDFNSFGQSSIKQAEIDGIPESDKENYLAGLEIKRLFSRGLECYETGRAYLTSKNLSTARRDFQRALKYFEAILKIDPANKEAREFRSKCLQKMA